VRAERPAQVVPGARRRAWLAAIALCAGLVGCAHRAAPGATAGSVRPRRAGIDYTFRVTRALDVLTARVCFHGVPPSDLVAGMRGGHDALRGAWLETARGRQPLRIDAEHDRIALAGVPAGACAGYAVDLASSGNGFTSPQMEHEGDALVTNTALWLWRPPDYRNAGVMHAHIVLPEGMRASVPWQRDESCSGPDCGYVLDPTALAFYAFAVFGQFESEQIAVPGATIDVAVLAGLPPQARASIAPWLETAAHAASLAFGRFPRKRAQVVVIPAPASSEPVRFGMMNRGGGASAAMRLPVNAERDALERDWVALHEFCHLLHPFVAHEDAWLPEGLATYFQEVLRARSGMQPETTAWRRLFDGARLGRGAEGSLAQESAGMFASASFKTVYWAGAAFALIADVEVRRHTHGRLSLDGVLQRLAPYFRSQPRVFTAAEVMARMDAVVGAPLFAPLMQRWVQGPELPQLDALYTQLGVSVSGETVQFAADAEDSWIRSAIMQREAEAEPPPASTADASP
jgi:hypothetical protein